MSDDSEPRRIQMALWILGAIIPLYVLTLPLVEWIALPAPLPLYGRDSWDMPLWLDLYAAPYRNAAGSSWGRGLEQYHQWITDRLKR